MLFAKDITDQAIVVAQKTALAITSHDARGILAAVLEREQGVVERSGRRAALGGENAGDAAHGGVALRR